MGRDLFVRSFDEGLHGELTELALREGVPLASVVEEAISGLLDRKAAALQKHHLILYDDDKSLSYILEHLERLTVRDWFRACCGPGSHFAMKFLKAKGWFDATPSQYQRVFEAPKQSARQAWQTIIHERHDMRTCAVGCVTEDLASKSLPTAIKVEEFYNSGNRIPGTMYCPYRVSSLLKGGLGETVDLFKNHDGIFVATENRFYKLRMTDESLHSLPN